MFGLVLISLLLVSWTSATGTYYAGTTGSTSSKANPVWYDGYNCTQASTPSGYQKITVNVASASFYYISAMFEVSFVF